MIFNLTKAERNDILDSITSELELSYEKPDQLIVSRELDVESVHVMANAFSFNKPNDAKTVMKHVVAGLKEHSVHVTHPSYYGLFNPRPNFPSIMADLINSYLNPQLAAWSHSPYACELERLVIKEFGVKYGYRQGSIDGTFCTGGAESNLTAVLCAIQRHMPGISENGLIGVKSQPLIYCSEESHHSLEKAAKTVGLGTKAIRRIPVNNDLTMNVLNLKEQIIADAGNGFKPLMAVGTAGTTGAGAIDDLDEIAAICKEQKIWFHVDAAYGGAAILTELKDQLKGIEKSDSLTLDLHKWFSVPMATSLFLTSDNSILHQTFNVRTNYMPEDGDQVNQIDPYIHSTQWSRRFIGLKIYLPLAVFGWGGYSKTISHQIEMANILKSKLLKKGWSIENESDLPIVCFSHPEFKDDDNLVKQFVERIIYSGNAWLLSYPINGKLTIRVCITNYMTQEEDVENLVALLNGTKNQLIGV